EEARPRIRWQAEAASHDFGDTFHDKVSDMVALALVYVDPAETQIMWLSPALAEHWGKTHEELWAAAVENMKQILGRTTVSLQPREDPRLGVLSTDLPHFKAALLFCPGLKDLVAPVVGWPLYAVMPCRDFVYVIDQNNRDLLGRMGHTVVEEYDKGSYPLSIEVFEITDQGIRAFADFQRAKSPQDREPGDEVEMKTVRYRGGFIVFRIPAHWVEHDAEYGGTFYDPDCPAARLRLTTALRESKRNVTTRSARFLLDGRDEPGRSEVIDLANTAAMI